MPILVFCHREWHWIRLVGFPFHLVNVPVGLQVTEVANPNIGSHSFYFLVIPKRESIVIAVSKNNSVWLAGFQVVCSKIAGCVAIGTVVVIPVFGSHNSRYQNQGCQTGNSTGNNFRHKFFQSFGNGQHTKPNPNSKRIERTGVGIITFAWLVRILIQINNNGQAGHKKHQKYHPQSFFAFGPLVVLKKHTKQTKQKWQEKIGIPGFVVGKPVG